MLSQQLFHGPLCKRWLLQKFHRNITASARTILVHVRYNHGSNNALPLPPALAALTSSEETAEARSWLEKFKSHKIPKGLLALSFSRSSGPGGQNVNKLNTKATIRCSINSSWIPAWARDNLKNDPHYVASTHSILITSTVHRSQSQNVDDCLSKLHAIIFSASSASIKNEPTVAQKKKVENHIRADMARKKAEKSYRSEIKKNRLNRGGGGGSGDWW